MALGEFTKQIAKQALGEQINQVMNRTPAVPDHEGNPSAAIVAQMQAMQKVCREDQELMVLLHTGVETLRIHEVYMPTSQLLVLTGLDGDRNTTRVITGSLSVQLVCKVVKVLPGVAPLKLNFLSPKPQG